MTITTIPYLYDKTLVQVPGFLLIYWVLSFAKSKEEVNSIVVVINSSIII